MICYLLVLLSCVFMTFAFSAAIVMWCPDMGVWFIVGHICLSLVMHAPGAVISLLYPKHTTLECVYNHYGEILLVLITSVIIFCLSLLLFDAFIYSSHYDDIEVSMESFMLKVSKQYLTILYLPIYILCGLLYGTSVVLAILEDRSNQPGSLCLLMVSLWVLAYIVGLLGYGTVLCVRYVVHFLTEAMEGNLFFGNLLLGCVFPMCCWGALLVLFFVYCVNGFSEHPYPGFYYWLSLIMWTLLVITVVATVLVDIPAFPLLSPATPDTPLSAEGSCFAEADDCLDETSQQSATQSQLLSAVTPPPSLPPHSPLPHPSPLPPPIHIHATN